MAEVFAARSYGAHGFEKTVALKRILPKFGHDPQFVRMMVDEAKISVLLNHPNIAQILEFGEQQGDYFIVMEFVPGQSLAAVVKRLQQEGTRLPVLESCFVVVELLQGLHSAHTQRDASGKPAHIIHRDVSPQNTLISFDGHVKVIDFGIARARDRLEATEVGTIKGKLRYLAPEMIDPGRFHPEGDFDHRVDVFAAGIVLWELVAGRTLFTGDDEMKVYDDITDGATPDLQREGRCDAALMKIIGRALERDLSRRFATAEDFADELRAYVYRSDPAFTHKRVAATLDRLFPDEKAVLLALERGQTAGAGEAEPPRDPARDAPRASSGSTASSSPSASGRGPAKRPEDTRAMRSDKFPSMPTQQAAAATALVDRDSLDPAGALPQNREVTVMTIVSRDSVLGTASGILFPAPSAAESVFSSADDATLTVSADTLRAALAAEARDARADARTAAPAMLPAPDAGPRGVAAATRVVDDTAPTRLRGSAGFPSPHTRVGGRVVAASAAVGVLLALAIVGVVEVVQQRPAAPAFVGGARTAAPGTTAPGTTAPGTTAPGTTAKVRVENRVTPTTAVITVAGKPWQPGLELEPAVPVVVEIAAPGYVTVRRAMTPVAGTTLTLDEVLVAEPSATDAGVTVASLDQPVVPAPSGAVPSGAVPSGAVPSGAVPSGAVPSGAVPSPTPAPSPAREDPAPPPRDAGRPVGKGTPPRELMRPAPTPSVRGEGTLLVKASPYWGQVTVNGRVLDEQTPVSVRLPAGKHDVVVSHPPRGLVRRFKVTIVPGQTVTRAVSFE
jgi:serine/threonine protein kinase